MFFILFLMCNTSLTNLHNIPASRRGQFVTNPGSEPGPLGGQLGDGARMDRAYMHWIGGGRSSSPTQRLHKGFQAQQ